MLAGLLLEVLLSPYQCKQHDSIRNGVFIRVI